MGNKISSYKRGALEWKGGHYGKQLHSLSSNAWMHWSTVKFLYSKTTHRDGESWRQTNTKLQISSLSDRLFYRKRRRLCQNRDCKCRVFYYLVLKAQHAATVIISTAGLFCKIVIDDKTALAESEKLYCPLLWWGMLGVAGDRFDKAVFRTLSPSHASLFPSPVYLCKIFFLQTGNGTWKDFISHITPGCCHSCYKCLLPLLPHWETPTVSNANTLKLCLEISVVVWSTLRVGIPTKFQPHILGWQCLWHVYVPITLVKKNDFLGRGSQRVTSSHNPPKYLTCLWPVGTVRTVSLEMSLGFMHMWRQNLAEKLNFITFCLGFFQYSYNGLANCLETTLRGPAPSAVNAEVNSESQELHLLVFTQ